MLPILLATALLIKLDVKVENGSRRSETRTQLLFQPGETKVIGGVASNGVKTELRVTPEMTPGDIVRLRLEYRKADDVAAGGDMMIKVGESGHLVAGEAPRLDFAAAITRPPRG
jgi:hypothetical protein